SPPLVGGSLRPRGPGWSLARADGTPCFCRLGPGVRGGPVLLGPPGRACSRLLREGMGLMRLRGFLLVLVVLVVLGLPAGAAAEEGCANEAVRQMEVVAHREGLASGLPDCRAYEQVTPVNKDGTNPSGFVDGVQASVAGGGV